MERNTLLAIALSIVVLFVYQAIFVPPKPVRSLNSPQNQINQETPSANNLSSEATNESQVPTNTHIEAKFSDLNNKNTTFSFANVGGTLHNVNFVGNTPFPITDVLNIHGFENSPYVMQKINDSTESLIYSDKNVEIKKLFNIQNGNLIKVRMEIKNLSEISNLNIPAFTTFEVDESNSKIPPGSREMALFEYSVYSNNKIFRKGNASKFSDKNNRSETTSVNWIGFRDHFNAIIVKPDFETKGYEIKTDSSEQLNISLDPADISLAPGQSKVYNFTIYSGPQNPKEMKKYNMGFEKIVVFSNFAIVEWIAMAIFNIIPFFHSVFKSWGIAIILISLLLYAITYPLTLKSMVSMRKMQEMQPKMAALKERYKNDPQKLNAEMIEIYRREKINPFGGCLPFLIQMPFFMALYQILWRAQYFQGQSFLWIKDLSQPDRLIIFPFYLPFLGNELNILPILTGCMMFVQQKVSSKNVVVTDEQQAMQQKMMMYILPVMMACMFYKFCSSWAIYFLTYYILSTFMQWKVAKASSGKK